jgi:hypothetical protein
MFMSALESAGAVCDRDEQIMAHEIREARPGGRINPGCAE